MYVVASLWEIAPGREADFEQRSLKMRDFMRSQPGVNSVIGFRTEDGNAMAVIRYEDKPAYDRIVTDPHGTFAKAAEENKLEEVGTWAQSWRGEEI